MEKLARRESLGREDLESLVKLALDEAMQRGVDQAEAAASHDTGLSATARLGDVENLEYTNDRGIGITVYKNSCKGSASTSDFSPAAVREAVAKACTFAEVTASDKYAGLADAELMCTDIKDLNLDHPWSIEAGRAIELAIDAEAAALGFDKRISNSEGATVSTNRGSRAYGNSHGFIGSFSRTSHSITCIVLAESDGVMQRDYDYTATRDPEDLRDAAGVGERAARRVINRLGARKIETTRAPVLYVPDIARGFIGHAIGAISGGAQYRRSSFLLDAIGDKIFPDFVNIQERPHLEKGMASAPYDAEGVATYDREIVTDGILQGYILSSYSARRLGLTTTANAGGAQNLVVPGGGKDKASLIREMGTGFLVEELIGQGVNGVTGDYSRGAVGQWIENGEVQFPVHEVTIAGNLRDLYPRIVAIGDDQDIRGGIRCGSLLVEEMTIAGA
ncbi:MAG: metalloprotease PmbA [Gammaproteobacteria bacterium]|nr:metalloprotease PmbA [Gammaproteobacteria bacterium]